jgi:hypothetical protein
MKQEKELNINIEIERKKILKLSTEYKKKGYEVKLAPKLNELQGYIPDLVVTKNNHTVVIEVKTKSTLTHVKGLDEIVRKVESLGWEFDLVVTNPISKKKIESIENKDIDQKYIDETLLISKNLLEKNLFPQALLLLWPIVEYSLRKILEIEYFEYKSSRLSLLADIYSFGIIDKDQFETLQLASRYRNQVAHGYLVSNIERKIFDNIFTTLNYLMNYKKNQVDEMIAWFFDNYMDPANGVPYESAEGGYQYVNGGPYNATDVLSSNFSNTTEEYIEEAVGIIENEGYDWVKRDDY